MAQGMPRNLLMARAGKKTFIVSRGKNVPFSEPAVLALDRGIHDSKCWKLTLKGVGESDKDITCCV